ncbi:alanine--tRNA ligase [Metallosphaera tengchongensis]|uniref:Alanine--tRNA ligase n=1 Tax=Metallosphaera tengchongensis TaxID=1532350 RepID=A0A6N0NVR1_9CREN|nr:alanine--tRNA ligase [Metallosphaera tengchongensis]QKR00936.1 alanine--tRNA ligase [Metallosphaera tengchongensis]
MKGNEEEYRLKIFFDNSYKRRECNVCHTPFWSKDSTRENCSDIPCSDYYFLEMKGANLNWSVSEARKRFLDFFNRHGHEIIPPKPVLARWREDLYLTIASIVDFQPFITSGIAPPPANPLVISQPCIRMDDVDNVGVTFGRHLTTFEMGGHHAFNYPDKFLYWKDETVNYAKEFFVNEMKIDEELLNFKESWWEGGGNAGPSFEVTVGGLELATLVFMQYEIKGNEYVPLKLKIVDTGYGIERLAWFTQRTPTAFHAIYGDLVDRFFNILGVPKVSDELLKVSSRFAGKIDPDAPRTVQEHREHVAKVLGINVKEVNEELTRAARVFQVLDHTKTIALMLGDGLVPSSAGEGYLGRLLIRRTMKTLKILGADVRLSELIKLQIDFWGKDFPQLIRNRDYIVDASDTEQEKFNEVLTKIPSVANALQKRKEVGINELIQLYDSNGIPPDLLQEEMNKRGVHLEIPHNFYSIVAKSHQSAPVKKDRDISKMPVDTVEKIKNLPETEKLFYKDQYAREFDAKVVASLGKYLVLDRTTFYPEGGGQLGDQGWITINGDRIKVSDTQKVNDVVVHILEREIKAEPGTKVHGEIDWIRRFRLMRHHTGTHVILAAAKKVLGDHVWQAGAEKTPEKARLDITHHKALSKEEVKKIEDLANMIIDDRRSVRPFEINRTEAEMKYGVSIYEGGVPNRSTIRLLEIKDWDIESCGGTHVSNTAEIGGIKIINVEKIQDGIIRLEYVAADVAANYARDLENKLELIATKLKTSVQQLDARVEKMMNERREMEDILNAYRKYILDNIERSVEVREIDGIQLIVLPFFGDEELEKELMKKLTVNSNTVVIQLKRIDSRVQVDVATSNNIDVSTIVEELRKAGAKGGGKKTFASVMLEGKGKDDVIDIVEKGIKGGGY